jgi:hypothetical protein
MILHSWPMCLTTLFDRGPEELWNMARLLTPVSPRRPQGVADLGAILICYLRTDEGHHLPL